MLIENLLSYAHDLVDSGDPDEAMRIVSTLLTEHPNNWQVLSVAGYINLKVERFGIAYNLIKRSVELMPNKSELYNNLGMGALGCMDLDEGERCLKRAIRVDPKNWRAYANLALVHVNKCEAGEALEIADKALALLKEPTKDDLDDINETKGYAHLMLGQWDPGWKCFESGLFGKVRRPFRPRKGPYWDGKPVEKMVVTGEQGIGDEISFASVIPSIPHEAIIECDSRLEGLFKRSFPNEVYGTRFVKDRQDFDGLPYCLSGSLCRYYRLRDEDYPGTSYLVADPERRLQWRALLDSLGPRPKVGIAWTGGRHNTHRERRSLRLEELLPILRQNAVFVSLQYKSPMEEIEALKEKHGIEVRHWSRAAETKDYDETAALVAELDLIISVQTAIVHLSGALGKECWAMIPREPLWRYKLFGDMPWYKSVRLFRQKKEWAGVINEVARELGRRANREGDSGEGVAGIHGEGSASLAESL